MRSLENIGKFWVVVGLALFAPAAWCAGPSNDALHVDSEDAEEDDDGPRNGLIASYSDGRGGEFSRREKSIMMTAGAQRPDRRLRSGRFSVRWQGLLTTPDSGAYRFYVRGTGRVQLKLGDRLVLDQTLDASRGASPWAVSKPVALEFDYHPLEVVYEKTGESAEFALFWAGPSFPLEPIPARNLYHDPRQTPSRRFEQGEQSVRALRCAGCHELPGEPSPLAAPSLDRLAGAVSRRWLTAWLRDFGASRPTSRRMPHFGLSQADAEALSTFLLTAPTKPAAAFDPAPAKKKAASQNAAEQKSNADSSAEKGKQLLLTVGCLACHRWNGHGSPDPLFSGGDLSRIAEKRPTSFLARWLQDPAALDAHARMPRPELSDEQRRQLVAFLATCGDGQLASDAASLDAASDAGAPDAARRQAEFERGRRLFAEHRCGGCHLPPDGVANRPTLRKLSALPAENLGCLGAPDDAGRRPGYRLSNSATASIREFVAALPAPGAETPIWSPNGRQLMVERNCVACHARDEHEGLTPRLPELAIAFPELAGQLSSLAPPSLLAVGDKLHDQALVDSIRRTAPPHRPWLKVQMPRYPLADEQLKTIVRSLIDADRIADDAPIERPYRSLAEPALHVAGSRLVTVDGFGCTSCHQIGKVKPVNAPLNARGSDLTQVGARVRLPWFDRWVRNPARIVPGMEMPSIQLAVRGVLQDDIQQQLAAVWQVLNTPGFEPPEPNPVQTLRLTGLPDRREPAELLLDVIKLGQRTLLKPALIGLPNRHSLLLDLETNQLHRWAIGDVARQRTKGKSWYWEAAGEEIWKAVGRRSDLALRRDENTAGASNAQTLEPTAPGQFVTELDAWRHVPDGLELRQRLHFDLSAGSSADASGGPTPASGRPATLTSVTVRQRLVARFADARLSGPSSSSSGFVRELSVERLPVDATLIVRAAHPGEAVLPRLAADGRSLGLSDGTSVTIVGGAAKFEADGSVAVARDANGAATLRLEYASVVPVDPFLLPRLKPLATTTMKLHVAPGFLVERLPLPEDQMPTALAWRPDGTLVFASLKGRVWTARDTNGDGLEDSQTAISDELPTPYGLHAADKHVDVVTKHSVVRLWDEDGDGRAERTETIASGWGHTDDYHDWAIGLPRDEQGGYFVALPCQQDKRSTAAARHRGTVLRLTPRTPTAEHPQPYALETWTTGHRFPMGLARNRDGQLFVTDNQGNYNPFNELNHVRRGAHFGFVNAIEKVGAAGAAPRPITPAAVEIPHPWTRSVNGVCFLETPASAQRSDVASPGFGPWEGHLVGCEYDTRRLVRMSLQRTGDTFHGAVYPLTLDKPTEGQALLGPLCCEVSPRGDLVVGGVRDSGWGGGNNIGEIARLRFDPASLPAGIAEVRSTSDGLEIDFARPVDAGRANTIENYAVSSYRRTATPAYGGPDQDRRSERIRSVVVSADARRATLSLGEMRNGFVYELRIKNLTAGGKQFFPAEAYVTCRP